VLGGRYRLVAPIGTGSSAQVFLADDVSLRRRVAVKVLHPALAGDEAFLRRFRAEARAAAALSHPNLMAVYDWGEDDGPYLVLELLGGGSLRALLDTGGRLSVAQAAAVGLDAARALGAAHRRGFVHRDIKPANLLFGDDGRLRIADFGLARALSEAAWTEPGDGLVGTARYAAPEQASSPRVDGKADVYALGLVLIEAVTGSVPLTADTGLGTLMRRVDTPVPVPEALGPLRPLLLEVGRANPADRPDAEGVERGLLEVARALDPPGPLSLPGAVALAVPSDPTLVAAPRTPPQARHGRGARSSAPRGAPFDDLAPAEVHGSAPPPAVSRAPAGGGTTAAGSRAPGSPAGDRAPEARGPAPTEADGAAGGDGDVPAWLAGDRRPGPAGRRRPRRMATEAPPVATRRRPEKDDPAGRPTQAPPVEHGRQGRWRHRAGGARGCGVEVQPPPRRWRRTGGPLAGRDAGLPARLPPRCRARAVAAGGGGRSPPCWSSCWPAPAGPGCGPTRRRSRRGPPSPRSRPWSGARRRRSWLQRRQPWRTASTGWSWWRRSTARWCSPAS
jgi:tRNA A-37 threonylcarbamoyl transferase component Bud32